MDRRGYDARKLQRNIDRMKTPDEIIQAVIEASGVTMEQLKSGDRKRHISLPRQIAVWMINRQTGESYQRTANRIGIKRGSVHNALCNIETQLKYKQKDTTYIYEQTLERL